MEIKKVLFLYKDVSFFTIFDASNYILNFYLPLMSNFLQPDTYTTGKKTVQTDYQDNFCGLLGLGIK